VRNYIANIQFKEISKEQTEASISSNWIDKSSSPMEMKQMFEGLYELMFLNAETQYLETNNNGS
jgi:23S rRNA maturation-related 3'-5' exoribonuclease YhaM